MTNLDCKDIKAILSGLVDDEVPREVRHQAERHLAECKACRDLVNEAEQLNQLVALDAQRQLWPAGLPSGFEDAVLRRTIYADAYHFAGRRWTSWLGWVAAAACLMLAVSIWILEHTRSPQPSGFAGINPVDRLPSAPSGSGLINVNHLRSWTSDRPISQDELRQFAGAPGGQIMDAALERAIDQALSEAEPRPAAAGVPGALVDLSLNSSISQDDADTLYQASSLLTMLARADLSSFADIERIRRIAEYDEILDRLASTRHRLSAADRPTVLAAESVLLRLINGPLDLDDLRMLHDTVASLDLPDRVQAISTRSTSASL